MVHWRLCFLLWLGAIIVSAPSSVRGQDKPRLPSPSRKTKTQEWNVFGRVTTLNVEPIAGVTVQIDIGSGPESVVTLQTNLKGDFQTDLSLPADSYKRLALKITATRPGYFDAWETADFESPAETRRVELVMRRSPEDPQQLALQDLIRGVGSRLRAPRPEDSATQPQSDDYGQGAAKLLDSDEPARAAPFLEKAARLDPKSIKAHTLLGLALLARGSSSSGFRELTQAATFNALAEAKTRQAEPFLALGVLETWRGHLRRARVFFLQALDVDSGNPLALQELGRVLVLEQNMKPADQYLKKAVKAGALAEAHLLRARALLGEGVPEEAGTEMESFLGGRKVKALPLALRGEWSWMEARQRLESRGKTHSVIDQSPEELITAIPELKTMQPAPTQDELAPILRKVGESVKEFFQNFPNTSSVEEITQERLHANGKVQASLQNEFQYLMLSQSDKDQLGLEEYRTNPKGQRVDPSGSSGMFMVTSGFASHSLHFHPVYQAGSTFRYLARQVMDGRNCYVVAFAQRPETATLLESFRVNSVSTLVLVQGVAWIDSSNYQIVRMRTSTLKTEAEINLQSQTTDVHFGEVQFTEIRSKLWLPREVVVTVGWNGNTLRNWHRYSDYKFFNVQARERRKREILSDTP